MHLNKRYIDVSLCVRAKRYPKTSKNTDWRQKQTKELNACCNYNAIHQTLKIIVKRCNRFKKQKSSLIRGRLKQKLLNSVFLRYQSSKKACSFSQFFSISRNFSCVVEDKYCLTVYPLPKRDISFHTLETCKKNSLVKRDISFDWLEHGNQMR